jgi:putative hydroxymethylpyrimidine transport system substrate-binding protein
MMVNKLIKYFFIIFICCYSNITFSSTNNNQQLQPLTLILDWFANPTDAQIYVAQQQGFFKQQGLDVNIIPPANPNDPPKLVAAGKADLAITSQPGLLLDVQQGLPLVRIATLINKPLRCMAVRANSDIKSIKDLKGKTVGYAVSGIDPAMLNTMLVTNGLTLQDVKLINVNYDLTQALLTGRVDAVIGIIRNFELIQMKLAGFNARPFYPEQNGVPTFDELILVTNKNELNDPRLPKFMIALKQGQDYLQQHPQQSWLSFAKNHPEINNELNHQAWNATLPDFAQDPGALDPKKYDQFAQFMLKQGLITRVIPVNTYAVSLGNKT